jgi:hypothetical protein
MKQIIKEAKHAAHQCTVKAAHYRQQFIRAAWWSILTAVFLGVFGLPMLFIFLPVGMIMMACAVIAAYDAVKAFRFADEAVKEYFEIRDNILDQLKEVQHDDC